MLASSVAAEGYGLGMWEAGKRRTGKIGKILAQPGPTSWGNGFGRARGDANRYKRLRTSFGKREAVEERDDGKEQGSEAWCA